MWKDFAERLQRLDRRVMHIDERWDNRLAFDKLVLPEDYFRGNFSIVAEVATRAPHKDRRAYVTLDYDASDVDVGAKANAPNFGSGNVRDQEVVFIPIAEGVQCSEGLVPSFGYVAVRFYPVRKQRLRLLDGPAYRSLFDGSYESLPVVANRKGALGGTFGVGCSYQAHPRKVQGRAHIGDNVAHKERDLFWDLLRHSERKGLAAGIRVVLETRGLGVAIEERLAARIQLIKVFAGPFDL